MAKSKSLLPEVLTAPFSNLFSALGHTTKAVDIFSEMLEASAETGKEITSLSLGAKAKQLAIDLADS